MRARAVAALPPTAATVGLDFCRAASKARVWARPAAEVDATSSAGVAAPAEEGRGRGRGGAVLDLQGKPKADVGWNR